MQFTRLWPSIFLLVIPGLILLYMLKKQNKKKQVSSLFLWQEIYETTYADKPWQKLRNHILLILQILGILFLVLSLMAPRLPWGSGYYKNTIFVVDCSASMKIAYEGKTRYEHATDWVANYLASSNGKTRSYLITASNENSLVVAGSMQSEKVLQKLNTTKPSYDVCDIEEAMQMAKTLGESLNESYEIIVLTDKKPLQQMSNSHLVCFGNSGQNGAISFMAYDEQGEEAAVLVQVTNKGDKTLTTDVSLFGEQQLLDVEEVELAAGEKVTLHFTLDQKARQEQYDYFKGEIALKDENEEDNTYYYIKEKQGEKRILLVTESNLFLEKALMTFKGCQIDKTTDIDIIDQAPSYDLYVLDRQEVASYPIKGNFLFIDCYLPDLLEEQHLTGTQTIIAQPSNMPEYLGHVQFLTNACKTYQLPSWGKCILNVGQKPIGIIGEKEGQKIGVLGFDLWQSDFVLTPEFPLFINYLGDFLLDNKCLEKQNFTSNEKVHLRLKKSNEKVKVLDPQNNEVQLNSELVHVHEALGIYQLQIEAEESPLYFAVNYPSNTESDMTVACLGEEERHQEAERVKANREITSYCIVLLIAIVSIEWYFYRKGY